MELNKPVLDEDSLLTEAAALELVRLASSVNCECPKHLVTLLNEVRKFEKYELDCVSNSEKDRAIHEWLHTSAVNLDRMLSGTIAQLARLEGMIDENNVIVPHP